MRDLIYEQEAERIEQQIASAFAKAFLVAMGLMFIILPSLNPGVMYVRVWHAFGALCLVFAALWICKEKRVLTQREELEKFLVEAAKRYARIGSITRLIEEYRTQGADEFSLSRLRGAPRLLRERAEDKFSLGLILSGAGSLFLLSSILLMILHGYAQAYLLKYGVVGAGLGFGHIAEGIRFERYARLFKIAQMQPPMSGDSLRQLPSVASDQQRDKAA